MREIRMSLVELYYLGTLMEAKYIDYSYIVAMPDIGKQYDLHEQEALAGLEKAGLIDVDFGGDAEVTDAARRLAEPVFFGTIETRANLDGQRNFHAHQGRITQARIDGEDILLASMTDDDLRTALRGRDVSLEQADVEKGYRNVDYTGAELAREEGLSKAIAFLKGE